MDDRNISRSASHSPLPFLQLSQMLDSLRLEDPPCDLPMRDEDDTDLTAAQGDLQDVSTHIAHSSSQALASLIARFHDEVLPVVEAVFPRSVVNHESCTSVAELSKTHLKLLIYAVTNNLAGLGTGVPLVMVYEYLKDPMTRLLDRDSGRSSCATLLHRMPSTKPMAETFFRCAIEAGDAQAVGSLLASPELSIDVDAIICVAGEVQYTPVERSARLQHLELTRLLLRAGADVNRTRNTRPHESGSFVAAKDPFLQSEFEHSTASGALECALQGRSKTSNVGYELVTALIQAGGDIGLAALTSILRDEDVHMMETLLRYGLRRFYHAWAKSRFLHEVASRVDKSFLLIVFAGLQAAGFDFSEAGYNCLPDFRPWWKEPGCSSTLIDIVAQRGELQLVKLLLQFGAGMTEDVLVASVRSHNISLVQFLLEQGAAVNIFSRHFYTTPFAEALRLQNPALIQLLGQHVYLDTLEDGEQLYAMLAATAEAGDFAMLKYMIELRSGCSEQGLGYALWKAANANKTQPAVILLESGATTASSDIIAMFRTSLNDNPARAQFEYGPGRQRSPSSPLTLALSHQNRILARKLLDHLDDRDTMDGALVMAVTWGDRPMIDDLLSAGVYRVDDALSVAVERGDRECVRRLCEACCAPSYRALEKAVGMDDLPMVQELLDNGAHCMSSNGLCLAVNSSPEMFQLVLGEMSRCLPRGLGFYGGNALAHAIRTDRRDLIHALIDAGAACKMYDLESRHREHEVTPARCPLAAAISEDRSQMLYTLRTVLESGVRLDEIIPAETEGGRLFPRIETPLLAAISTEQLRTVRLIVEYGANVNLPATKRIKRTPLQKAAEIGSYAIVRLLLNEGADVNGLPAVRSGATAFQLAARGGYIGIAELLLEHDADPAAPGAIVDGRTAIEGAAQHGRFDTVAFLLKLGFQRAPEVENAKRHARDNGHNAIVDLLEDAIIRANPEPAVVNVQLALGHQGPAPMDVEVEPARVEELFEMPEHEAELAQVENVVEPPGDARYVCGICNTSVSNASALRRHERSKHTDVFPPSEWECDVCPKSFSRKDTLDRHKATHDKNGYIGCSSCGKRFRPDYVDQHQTRCKL